MRFAKHPRHLLLHINYMKMFVPGNRRCTGERAHVAHRNLEKARCALYIMPTPSIDYAAAVNFVRLQFSMILYAHSNVNCELHDSKRGGAMQCSVYLSYGASRCRASLFVILSGTLHRQFIHSIVNGEHDTQQPLCLMMRRQTV